MIVGVKDDFAVHWSCAAQVYTVFYKERMLTTGYRFRDVKCYLD